MSATLPGVRDEFQVTRNAVAAARRRRRASVDKIVTVTPDPQVWAAAVAAADGDTSRLEVLSATEVRVHNRPVKR